MVIIFVCFWIIGYFDAGVGGSELNDYIGLGEFTDGDWRRMLFPMGASMGHFLDCLEAFEPYLYRTLF